MGIKIDKSVKNFLLDFGLTDKEITVYTTLLKTGPNTIMNLARETSIKRSTTHNTVEELIKKGLVSQTNYGERRMVIAEDPDKLKFLMEQKKWDINKLEKNLPDTIQAIQGLVPASTDVNDVEVKYFTGEKGVQMIYTEALRAQELRSYANIQKIFEVFPDNSEIFRQAHITNKDLKLWEIVENSEVAKEYASKYAEKDRYHYKLSPVLFTAGALDILIYDGKVAVITVKEGVTGVVISNKDYYNNTAAVFDFVWSALD
ncbi:hypothetical protein DOJK_00200 [Patescibacteria group bacterium]|nr:hypothetical protein [Candidatus Dojkabacteria bacterium]CAG1020244.1 hypothetical protein DOJK_00200 [Patescibacteria group bacterium]